MSKGIFTNKTHKPTIKEIHATLSSAKPLWDDLVRFIEDNYDVEGELKFYGKNFGWALRYRKSGRVLISLYPDKDEFKIQIILNEEQVKEALKLDLNQQTKRIIEETAPIHEGKWIYLNVTPDTGLLDIKNLITVRSPVQKIKKKIIATAWKNLTGKLDLEDIVLIGRSFEEYYKFFKLHEIGKNHRILDVASGVSSFTAEANLKNYNVTAADKIYQFPPDIIENKCAADLETVLNKLDDVLTFYKWGLIKDRSELERMRKKAYKVFITDFEEKGNASYIPTEFPKTRFKDNQFTISLISHFLFLYDDHLDYEFHKETILELIRITSDEIRIFPIVNLRYRKSLFVDKLMKDPNFTNYKMKIKKVDYEFIKNGNQMLKINLG